PIFCQVYAGYLVRHSFPTRRSSDLSLTVDEVEDILLDTAKPKTDDEYPDSPNNGYGYGLVDGYGAVQSVIHGFGTVTGTVTESEIGRAHVLTPVTFRSRMPSSA